MTLPGFLSLPVALSSPQCIGKASCPPIPMLFPPAACFISASTTSEKLPVHRFRCFFLQPLALSQPPPHRKSFLLTDSDAFSSNCLLYLDLHYIGKASCPPIPMLFPPAACFISTSTTSEKFHYILSCHIPKKALVYQVPFSFPSVPKTSYYNCIFATNCKF